MTLVTVRQVTRRPHAGCRGFSLLESVIVLVLVGIITAASIAWFGNSTSPEGDNSAKTALATVSELQRQVLAEGDAPADATKLGTLDYSRTYTTAASTSPQVVSVAVAGTLVFAAVDSGKQACWMLRFESTPTPSSPPELWYVDSGRNPCQAADVPTLSVSTTADGTSPDNPVVL